MKRIIDGVEIEMTQAEIAEHRALQSDEETSLAVAIRAKRNRLLSDSDWTQLKDSTLDETAQVLWQAYRQALRDVPQQERFPYTVTWPMVPDEV